MWSRSTPVTLGRFPKRMLTFKVVSLTMKNADAAVSAKPVHLNTFKKVSFKTIAVEGKKVGLVQWDQICQFFIVLDDKFCQKSS